MLDMYTKPKKLIKLGFYRKYKKPPEFYADVRACIDYETGEVLYYTLSPDLHTSLDFPSFEELMMYADLHDIKIDTYGWDSWGIVQFYTIGDKIGSKHKFYDGTIRTLAPIK